MVGRIFAHFVQNLLATFFFYFFWIRPGRDAQVKPLSRYGTIIPASVTSTAECLDINARNLFLQVAMLCSCSGFANQDEHTQFFGSFCAFGIALLLFRGLFRGLFEGLNVLYTWSSAIIEATTSALWSSSSTIRKHG